MAGCRVVWPTHCPCWRICSALPRACARAQVKKKNQNSARYAVLVFFFFLLATRLTRLVVADCAVQVGRNETCKQKSVLGWAGPCECAGLLLTSSPTLRIGRGRAVATPPFARAKISVFLRPRRLHRPALNTASTTTTQPWPAWRKIDYNYMRRIVCTHAVRCFAASACLLFFFFYCMILFHFLFFFFRGLCGNDDCVCFTRLSMTNAGHML